MYMSWETDMCVVPCVPGLAKPNALARNLAHSARFSKGRTRPVVVGSRPEWPMEQPGITPQRPLTSHRVMMNTSEPAPASIGKPSRLQ